MAKTLDDLLRERPGNSAAQARHRRRMLGAVRRHQLAELRAIWRTPPFDADQER
ncbi:MAG TPA: hypothetical protein VFC57_06620 [Aeromicrobium sp.]|nr:hypothetical protein [Aeromicrobium sp.]